MPALRRTVFVAVVVFLLGLSMLGCGGQQPAQPDVKPKPGELQVVTTISILADIAQNVAGSRGQVTYIVPIGEEPEHYEPVPSDFQKVAGADILFANGLGLEAWLGKIVSKVTRAEIVHLAEGAPTIPLVGQDGADPHLWFNPRHVADHYVENILNTLIRLDPEGANDYRRNAELYRARLYQLDAWIAEQVERIAPENRVIVTSENALKYFGAAYGFDTAGIWELNAHEEGTPRQIASIVDLVRDRRIPAVFVETTVDRRYMEAVAKDTGVPVAGTLYTDALGLEGSGAETYIGMMRHNVHTLVRGLR